MANDNHDPDQACTDPILHGPTQIEYEAYMIALTLSQFHEKYKDEDSHGIFHEAMDTIARQNKD